MNGPAGSVADGDLGRVSCLATRLGGDDGTIKDVWQNTEGWSMETFSLSPEYTKGGTRIEQEIIFRRQRFDKISQRDQEE